ncbi:MAG: glycosyltransferase family A protein [Casimicrobiaceae bacterium]
MIHVDVVIPAFNAANYLREAIESVFAQSHPVARVIVVDDGSTDPTVSIATAFGSRVEVVALEGNRGAAAARNAGIDASDSPLVAFLDADDRWLPPKIDAQCAALAADAAVMFALCRLRTFASPELPVAEQALLVAQHAAQSDGWLASTLVVRRELLAKVGLFAEDLRLGETIDWFSRAREHPFVHVDSVGVERRLHRHNTTRVAHGGQRDYLRTAQRHLARLRGNKTL